MDTIATILAVILGIAFLGAGGTKLAGMKPHPEEFDRYGLPGLPPQQARLAVGAVEVAAAILLLLGALTDSSGLAVLGALVALCAMVGALATHLRLKDPPPALIPASVLLALAVATVATAA